MSTIDLSNLEDRLKEMGKLGASKEAIEEMESKMRLGLEKFQVRETKPATTKGHIDTIYNFKTAGTLKKTYMTNFRVEHHKIKPLQEGQSYFIITPRNEKNEVKKLSHPIDAIEQFKKRDDRAELSVGKDVGHRSVLATMEDGKVNFVAGEFRAAFYGKPIDQTFSDGAKNFSAFQAGNLVQGRGVHRGEVVTPHGEITKAWMVLDLEKGKVGNNFQLHPYLDPNYGFDLSKVLNDYNIKELNDPKKRDELETALKDGDRPIVTVTKDGKDKKLHLETAVKYKKVNFFNLDGTMEKREQFLKEPAKENNLLAGKDIRKEKDLVASQELTR